MIQLTRVRTAAAIPTGFRGPKRVERLVELISAHHAGEFNFNSAVWKTAKNQLKKESSGKCAYCEAPTSAVAHGDVEHFRPKSVYWWLAYCYENYTYSCQICNQTYKGDRFPAEGPLMQPGNLTIVERLTPDPLNEVAGLPFLNFHTACLGETAHLPDVYHDDPESLFKWLVDPVKKEVRLAQALPSLESQRAAAAAEDVLGLNRPELMGLRWIVYEDLDAFRAALTELAPGGVAAGKVRNRIKSMMENSGEFAGMVRYFVRKEWNLNL